MKKQSSLALILIFSLLATVLGQNPTPAQTGRPANDDDVVRISTNLIQVDAVVTDKDGKQVTDLRADEFEIQENGQKQKITNFSYVPLISTASPSGTSETSNNTNADVRTSQPSAPPPSRGTVTLRAEDVRRTIALVVDDLGLSFDSIQYVRRALKKFVDEQMQPGDMVAVVTTSVGVGAFQQFTSDRRLLHATIERVRWNPLGRSGLSPFAPIEGEDFASETRAAQVRSADPRIASESLEEFSDELFTVGTLGALNHVIKGLKDLPGRKSVMLFSDGIKILNSEGRSIYIMDDLRRLTDLANRASVVIYTIDSRGVPILEMTASDDVRGMRTPIIQGSPGRGGYTTTAGSGGFATSRSGTVAGMSDNRVNLGLQQRRTELFNSQQGMNYLADETGGLAFRNSNDLAGGLKKMLEGEQGYYLIGYLPNDETFDPNKARFNKLTIKVKRPGLKVRYRSGFFGVKEEDVRPAAPVTRAQQLVRTINAPFASGAIEVRLTSLFANDVTSGSYMRSIMHIDANKLTFIEEPEGWRKVVFDIMAITFGLRGEVVDEISRTENLRVRGESYSQIMENGFDYIFTVPIKMPGAYQLRTALRDSATQRIGSANQFIVVPDLNKNRLALSGIIVSGFDFDKLKARAEISNASGGKLLPEPRAGAGDRRMRRGLVLEFGYLIYNAQLDKTTQRPRLQTQIRLFRAGNQIFAGDVLPFDSGTQADLKRLNAGGRIQLGTDMSPGDYVLQVIVTDTLAKEKQRTATQWIDFTLSDK